MTVVLTLFAAITFSVPTGLTVPPASDFRAVGDGKTDDTTALQNLVDAGEGIIRLPKGVYRITKPIVIDLDKLGYTSIRGDGVSRIVMAGPGPALRLVGTHFKSANPGGFTQNVWDRQRMPLIDGVAIRGDHPEAIGIEAVGTMQLTITRTHIQGVLHGIHLVKNNRNVLISDCLIRDDRPKTNSKTLESIGGHGNMIVNNLLGDSP